MIKEIIIALVLGALLGFGATGSFYAFKKQQNGDSPKQIATPTPLNDEIPSTETTPEPEQAKLKIISPQNESITDQKQTDLKISTIADSFLIISTPLKDFNIKVDETGLVEQSINLEPGVNVIKISAIDPDLNQYQQELILTYSTADI